MINMIGDTDYVSEKTYTCIKDDFHFNKDENYIVRLYNYGGLFGSQYYRIFDINGGHKYTFDSNSAYDRNIFPKYFINIKEQRKEKLEKIKKCLQ